jgi:hypothetical protein
MKVACCGAMYGNAAVAGVEIEEVPLVEILSRSRDRERVEIRW